jgi:SAM-dependent methyltransferase
VVGSEGALVAARETRFVIASLVGHKLRHHLGVRDATFVVDGRELRYARVAHAGAWRTERSVEVPLAVDLLARRPGTRVLEVGNVLANYGVHGHDIVDKYEVGPGVENVDVVDLDRPGRYDVVLAVSTLEHVGFDESPREPGKLRRAVEVLREAVAPGGLLFVTLPLGYNPEVDEGLALDGFGFHDCVYLQRVNRANEWRQVDAVAVRGERYDAPFPKANAVFAGTWHRPASEGSPQR